MTVTLFRRDLDGQVQELDLYAWNTGDLYPARLDVVRKMLAAPADKAVHVAAWRQWYDEAAKRYRREFPRERVIISYEAVKLAAEERCAQVSQAIEIGEYDFLKEEAAQHGNA